VSLIMNLCSNKQRWDNFVDLAPQGNIFCTTAFLDALGEDYDLVLIDENNQLKMGAIILKQSGTPIRAPYPFTLYHGILFDNSIYEMPRHRRAKKILEITEYLLKNLSECYNRISFCLHYNVDDLRSFQWFNYHNPEKGQFLITLRYTGILDLATWSSFDQYLLNIRTVRRQEYNKLKSSGFILESSDDIGILDQLHSKTFARQGIERKEEEVRLLGSITGTALANEYGRLLVCKSPEGIPISATVFLYDNRCAYYMFAATDPEYRKTGCGSYLMLENIRKCMEKGVVKVDMVGINSPRRGDFKTSFNAVQVPYFIVHWEKPA
jgi:GNAT superfamily N-acetyltransferase